jgi:hypothetical protein
LEQADERLLAGISLSKHRGSSLLKDLEAGELTAFGRDIDINDTAVRGFEVDGIDLEQVLGKTHSTGLRAILRTHVREALESGLGNNGELVRVGIE